MSTLADTLPSHSPGGAGAGRQTVSDETAVATRISDDLEIGHHHVFVFEVVTVEDVLAAVRRPPANS